MFCVLCDRSTVFVCLSDLQARSCRCCSLSCYAFPVLSCAAILREEEGFQGTCGSARGCGQSAAAAAAVKCTLRTPLVMLHRERHVEGGGVGHGDRDADKKVCLFFLLRHKLL